MRTKLIFILFFLLAGCANDITVNRDLSSTPQNSLIFATKGSTDIKYQNLKDHLANNYLKHYFSPWHNHDLKTIHGILHSEYQQIKNFSDYPGFGENAQWYNDAWMKKIAHIMNLAAYPNLKMNAIVYRNTSLRVLPTEDPSFNDWYKPGQGYPFDNLQTLVLAVNTPLYVLHESRNGEWVLVITPYECLGWVKSTDIAYVKHIEKWMFKNYIVTTFDNQPVFDQNLVFYTSSRIGQLFPLYKITKSYYQVIIPTRNNDGYAIPKIVNIRKTKSNLWPVNIAQKNIATVANNMLGQTYGWGELYSYRDCSSSMEALFAPFGIWLPRNSKSQITEVGNFIDLSNYNTEQKLNFIISKGVPFLTLLWLPGHIMLYIGEKNGQAYVLHNFWGLHIKQYFSSVTGRAIVGRNVIMPLNFGNQYINVEQNFLERIQGMSLLL